MLSPEYDPRLALPFYEYAGKGIKLAKGAALLIGIELEYEGTNLLGTLGGDWPFNFWTPHPEGSLRGGIEYVLRKPITLLALGNALDELVGITKNAKFNNSIRTSTHIHINASNLQLIQIYNVLTAYYLFENVLVRLNGIEREGNLHCLRLKDSMTIASKLADEISDKKYFSTWQNNERYAALNLAALRKFGSLEFRFLRALTERNDIELWVRALTSLVETASVFDYPHQILQEYYSSTPRVLLEKFFPEEFVRYIRTKLEPAVIRNLMAENTPFLYEIISNLSHSNHRNYVPDIQQIDEDLKGFKKEENPMKNLGAVALNPSIWQVSESLGNWENISVIPTSAFTAAVEDGFDEASPPHWIDEVEND